MFCSTIKVESFLHNNRLVLEFIILNFCHSRVRHHLRLFRGFIYMYLFKRKFCDAFYFVGVKK